MRLAWFGEEFVRVAGVSTGAVRAVEGLAGVRGACFAFGELGVLVGQGFEEERLRAVLAEVREGADLGRERVVGVRFDGEDLGAVAAQVGLDVEAVVELLLWAEFRVEAVGFAPGFPYMTGVPEALAGLGRRDSPRTRVRAGSFAIAAGMAGIYPAEMPGGWWLLGEARERGVEADFRVGDRVRLERWVRGE